VEDSSIRIKSILKGRGQLMIKRIRKSLTLKWMIFSILLATIPLTIAGFNIIQIYQRDLKKSVIVTEEMKASMVVERTEAFLNRSPTIFMLWSMPRSLNWAFLPPM
jgi:hypothetical protein